MHDNAAKDEAGALDDSQPEQLSLAQIFGLIKNGWRVIAALTVVLAVIAGCYGITCTPLYRSYYVIMPVPSESDALRSASLSVDILGRKSSSPEWQMYLSLLTSSTLAEKLTYKSDVMQHLFAASWDKDKKAWITRPDFWSLSLTGKIRWLIGQRTVPPPDKFSLQGYLKSALNVQNIPDSMEVMVSIDSADPQSALLLLTQLHQAANDIVREAQLTRAQGQREHLLAELKIVAVTDYRQALLDILGRVETHIMTASVGGQYAAVLVDGPVTIPIKVFPQPKLFVQLAIIAGLILGLILVVFTPVNDEMLLSAWHKARWPIQMIRNRRIAPPASPSNRG